MSALQRYDSELMRFVLAFIASALLSPAADLVLRNGNIVTLDLILLT
jgi:hypothetical protein